MTCENESREVTKKVDLVIKNCKIVSPTGIVFAGITVDKGKIVAIGSEESLPSADKTIDAGGKYILPGVCDMHCHPDFEPCPPFNPWTKIARTEPQAAALGGVTTMGFYLMPPEDQTLADVFDEYRKTWEANSILDGVFHIMVVNEQRLDEMEKDCSEFGVTDFKFPFGYKKGTQTAKVGAAGIDDGLIVDAFQRIVKLREKGWPALALVHAEDADIIPLLRKEVQKRYDVRAWHDSRPNFVEEECVRRIVFLAGVTGCPVLIVHTTIKEAVDAAARARYEGKDLEKDILIETCPQYLTHNHDNLPPLMHEKLALTVVNPPIRTKEDNEGLWQGIKDGLVTVMGSDLAPTSKELKEMDMWSTDFVPMGVGNNSGMILPVLLSEGVNKRGLSLERVVEVSSYNPARYYSLYPRKGTISVGSDADVVIVDIDKEVTYRAEMSPSSTGWSIYDGWKFKGWPVMTILRGKVIIEDRKILAKPGYGRYIPRMKR